MAAMAEFERDLISERTRAGLEAARIRGKKGGGPRAINKLRSGQLERAKEPYAARKNAVEEIMRLTGFKSRATFYKYVVNGDASASNGKL
jgi:DNA invertase Pin-like site-specific DNA recombinase